MRRLRLGMVILVIALLLGACAGVPTQPSAPWPPSPGRWTTVPVGPLSPRNEATGAWLDGRFVLVGGWAQPPCSDGGSCAAPTEPPRRDGASFDPATGSWQRIADAPFPVTSWNCVVAGGRLYLLTSGWKQSEPTRFLRYDPGSNTWTSLPRPLSPDAGLVLVADRVVAIASSDERKRAVDSVFDPRTETWRRLPDDPLGPSFDRGGTAFGDQLLLTASDLVPNPGAEGPSLTRLAALDATLTRWTRWPDSEIIGGNAIAVANRVVFPGTGSADGGEVGGWGRSYPEGGILDPVTGRWQPLPDPPLGVGLTGYVRSMGDRTLVAGHLLQPATRRWTPVPQPPWSARMRSQTVLTNAKAVLVWGGSVETTNVAEGYLLVP